MKKESTTYYGIGDAHGLESVVPLKDVTVNHLIMRATANRHRHAVVFKATLSPEQKDHLDELMKSSPKEALKLLKLVPNIEVEKNFQKSWDMIPNSHLDPYSG